MASIAILQRGMEAAVSNINAVLLKAKLQHIKSTWNLNRTRRVKVPLLMSILYVNSNSLSLSLY
jgi:hypothetical protein